MEFVSNDKLAEMLRYQQLCDHARDLRGAGRTEEEIEVDKEILILAEKLHGSEHAQTAIGYHNLAIAYENSAHHALARINYELALKTAISSSHDPDNDDRVTNYRGDLESFISTNPPQETPKGEAKPKTGWWSRILKG